MEKFDVDILRELDLEFCSDESKPTHATSLLLWFSRPKITCKKVAELGCGVGTISIGLAKMYNLKVLGIDIERTFIECAKRNAQKNLVDNLVEFLIEDVSNIRKYNEFRERFDMVVFNPPHHFESKESNKELRRTVRNSSWNKFEDFLKATFFLLKNKGDFSCVVTPRYLVRVLKMLSQIKLQPKEICVVHGTKSKKAELVLIRGKKNGGEDLKILPPIFLNELT